MASEDSDQIMSGCLTIHCLSNLCNFDQARCFLMQAVINHAHTTSKPFKVGLLGRMQGMSLKERDYRSQEILPAVNNELGQMLTMIIVPLHDIHATYAKEALKLLKRRPTADTLRHDKTMSNLVPGFVAFSTNSAWLPNEPDGEASLSVHKTNNPA
jgi:hypothetical protein